MREHLDCIRRGAWPCTRVLLFFFGVIAPLALAWLFMLIVFPAPTICVSLGGLWAFGAWCLGT